MSKGFKLYLSIPTKKGTITLVNLKRLSEFPDLIDKRDLANHLHKETSLIKSGLSERYQLMDIKLSPERFGLLVSAISKVQQNTIKDRVIVSDGSLFLAQITPTESDNN